MRESKEEILRRQRKRQALALMNEVISWDDAGRTPSRKPPYLGIMGASDYIYYIRRAREYKTREEQYNKASAEHDYATQSVCYHKMQVILEHFMLLIIQNA